MKNTLLMVLMGICVVGCTSNLSLSQTDSKVEAELRDDKSDLLDTDKHLFPGIDQDRSSPKWLKKVAKQTGKKKKK